MSVYVSMQKLQGETLTQLCSFLSRLAPGEVAMTCASSVGLYTGDDPNGVSMLLGDPAIQPNQTDVVQEVLGGLPGVIYILYLAIRTSLNNVLIQEIKIAVQP